MHATSRGIFGRKITLAYFAGALSVLPLAATASADEVFKATSAVTGLGSQNILGFDISFVDPALGLYILGDRTNKAVDVVDTTTNALIAQVGKGTFTGATGNNNTSGPDGVLFVDQKEIWAGDGNSTLKIFGWPSGTLVVPALSTGGANRVDEMCYDPRDHLVMVANNAETPFPFATLVDSTTHTIKKKITFDGTNGTPKATNGAEQCQWDQRTGKFYISVPEINGPGDNSVAGGVSVIDPKSMTVEKTFTISHDYCAGPQGMAIGPDDQILLGCNGASGDGKHSTVIISDESGGIIAVLNNESGADEVWFNEGDRQYFLARSSAFGPNQLLGVVDAVGHREDKSGPREDQSVPIAKSGTINAHSVAADPEENQVYVPIPGANTMVPAGASTVCSSVGGSDTQGCIAVFTAKHDDRSRVAHERERDDRQE
jgi:hypothetical protein